MKTIKTPTPLLIANRDAKRARLEYLKILITADSVFNYHEKKVADLEIADLETEIDIIDYELWKRGKL